MHCTLVHRMKTKLHVFGSCRFITRLIHAEFFTSLCRAVRVFAFSRHGADLLASSCRAIRVMFDFWRHRAELLASCLLFDIIVLSYWRHVCCHVTVRNHSHHQCSFSCHRAKLLTSLCHVTSSILSHVVLLVEVV